MTNRFETEPKPIGQPPLTLINATPEIMIEDTSTQGIKAEAALVLSPITPHGTGTNYE